MKKVNLAELHMLEGWYESDQSTRQRTAFPFYKATGTENSSVVYFELEPGNTLGTHTDSAEEILFIMEGEALALVGEEETTISKGEMTLVPKMIPHNIKNIGSETLKVLGFYAAGNVVSTFSELIMPIRQNIVGTPPIFSNQPLEWNQIVQKLFSGM